MIYYHILSLILILKGLHNASILTPHLLNQILKMAKKCQYFIPTLEALLKFKSAKMLSQSTRI